ncbi:MAG: phosphoribosylaminoimidazolesuccinocarboxamide synthase [Victivallales bacterium]|nr:phosphoribosylaminoimidazolesuccinocarboxamide synthase [Victivallales bacterium]
MLSTEIPELPNVRRGKVRDVYDLGDSILFVATDRISAFDCVMPNGIPGKGRVLAQVTLNWFKVLTGIKNHLITADVAKYPAVLQQYAADLEGRSMLVRKLNMLPVECIVRGYLTGSGWSSYQKTGKVCGIPLREGYQNASKLDEPIFTPTTKAETGHDEAISFEELSSQIGSKLADALRNASIALYNQAAEYARQRGIIIADTKFEFGTDENGDLILADEVLTPDSSRFWPVASYQVGKNPPSLDKQFVRDWLDSVHFNHQPPAPELPPEVVQKTREKYEEALESLRVKG